MDPSGENFSIHSYSETFYPPGLSNHFQGLPLYEEFDDRNSSEFPSQSTL